MGINLIVVTFAAVVIQANVKCGEGIIVDGVGMCNIYVVNIGLP